ncbi:MAG: hypothetical protein ACKO3P_09970, partial [Planctomycetaceae bacterium]
MSAKVTGCCRVGNRGRFRAGELPRAVVKSLAAVRGSQPGTASVSPPVKLWAATSLGLRHLSTRSG